MKTRIMESAHCFRLRAAPIEKLDMSRSFKISVAAIVIITGAIAAQVSLDTRAIQKRRTKAAELTRVADRLRTNHMSVVLSELGSPSHVHLDVARTAEDDGSKSHLVFTYEYTFRSTPWMPRQRVWITIRFDDRLRATLARVDEEFS